MDYMTKGISRKDLRTIAKWFKGINGTKNKLRFDSVGAFERFPSLFPNVTTEIVPDDDNSEFSVDSPGTCIPDMNGNYRILIRESTYDAACRGVGGPRSHLVHEMSHAILCMLGYTPVLERSYKNGGDQTMLSFHGMAGKSLNRRNHDPLRRDNGQNRRTN